MVSVGLFLGKLERITNSKSDMLRWFGHSVQGLNYEPSTSSESDCQPARFFWSLNFWDGVGCMWTRNKKCEPIFHAYFHSPTQENECSSSASIISPILYISITRKHGAFESPNSIENLWWMKESTHSITWTREVWSWSSRIMMQLRWRRCDEDWISRREGMKDQEQESERLKEKEGVEGEKGGGCWNQDWD